MTEPNRIKGRRVDLDYDSIKAFFEARGGKQYASPLSATMYSDQDPGLVERRDAQEKARLLPLLTLPPAPRILDIGCGIGRWAWPLAERYPHLDYFGIDLSTSLIAQANSTAQSLALRGLRFQAQSATELDVDSLMAAGGFDLVIISALLMYMNDEDAATLLDKARRLLAPGALCYLREPLGLDERFTLDRFFSSELQDDYSAIYRSLGDMTQRVERAFVETGCRLLVADSLFADELERRKETRQYFFLLQCEGH